MLVVITSVFALAVSVAGLMGLLNPVFIFVAAVILVIFLVNEHVKFIKLFRENTSILGQLKRTNEVIHALLTTTNLNKLLSLIMDNLTKGNRFDSAYIYQVENENILRCIATKGAVALSGIRKFTFTLQNTDKIIGRAIKSRIPIMVQDARKDYLTDTEITDILKLKQFIILPLVVREKIVGLIIIGNSQKEALLMQEDLITASTIANQAAIALQNARLYSKIQDLSVLDELTQLYNHRFFQQRIREEIELAKRYNSSLALAIIDIDFFKNYNDKNGHLAGDNCLRQVASVIMQSLRKTDVVARYGGEEFAVILPATDKAGAMRIIEKIRYDMERYPFEYRHRQPEGKLTISAGIAVFPQDAKEHRELINLADKAVYRAKGFGRNRVIIHE